MKLTIDTITKTIVVETGTIEEISTFLKKNYKDWRSFNVVSAYNQMFYTPSYVPQPTDFTGIHTSN